MARVFENSMAARAGFVEVRDENGDLITKYQAISNAFTQVSFGDNRQYIVQPGDTWQNIALRLLGSGELWWVLAEWNRIIDPITELFPGKRLNIPAPNRVRLGQLSEL